MSSSLPIDTIDHSDAGPDTMGRYRYQATFAAIVSLDLLNEKLAIQEMYHEHHEDVFVLQNNGKYVLYQVKTRLPKYSPLKFNDPLIYHAVKKFVRFEQNYPDACEKFVLVSNCPFYTTNPTSNNLEYCIQLSKNGGARDTDVYSGPMKNLITDFDEDGDLVLKTLRKVELFPASPLGSLDLQLRDKIWSYLEVDLVSKEKLNGICDSLVEKMNKSGANMYGERGDSSLRYGDTEKNIDKDVNIEIFEGLFRYIYTLSETSMSTTQFIIIDNDLVKPDNGLMDFKSILMTHDNPEYPPLIPYYKGA